MDLDEAEVIENIKKERGQYLAIVTGQVRSMNDLLNGRRFLHAGPTREISSWQDGPSEDNLIVLLKHSLCKTKTDRTQTKRGYLSAWIANQNRAFASTCPLADLAI